VDAVLIGRRALTLVVIALVLFVGGVGAVLSIVALANSAAIERIEELRRDRVAADSATDLLICEENNRQDTILTALLKSDRDARNFETIRPALTDEEKTLLRESLAAVTQKNCSRLPSTAPGSPVGQ
jgi:hypothetical protein